MTDSIRILLVEDHPIMRGGLQAMINFEVDMSVVGQAADGFEALEQYRILQPDVVIMDLLMPLKDGVEATSDICLEFPQAHILALTSYSESDKILMAMQAGALGYILKNARPEDLLQAIREVNQGKVFIQPVILQQILRHQVKPAIESDEDLTSREYEILKLVARGATNDEIAIQFDISKRTVNVHITNIMSKLHLVNRAQMVLYAARHGMIGLFSE